MATKDKFANNCLIVLVSFKTIVMITVLRVKWINRLYIQPVMVRGEIKHIHIGQRKILSVVEWDKNKQTQFINREDLWKTDNQRKRAALIALTSTHDLDRFQFKNRFDFYFFLTPNYLACPMAQDLNIARAILNTVNPIFTWTTKPTVTIL